MFLARLSSRSRRCFLFLQHKNAQHAAWIRNTITEMIGPMIPQGKICLVSVSSPVSVPFWDGFSVAMLDFGTNLGKLESTPVNKAVALETMQCLVLTIRTGTV